jgi:hypothetical protein
MVDCAHVGLSTPVDPPAEVLAPARGDDVAESDAVDELDMWDEWSLLGDVGNRSM